MNESELFEKLLAMEDPAAQSFFLGQIEAVDPRIGRSLRDMLVNYSPMDSFLETPAVEQIARDADGESFLTSLHLRFQEPKRYSKSDLTLDFLSPPTLPGTLGNLAGYEIHEIIGFGGSGVVLRAKDPNLSKWFAIKVMHSDQAGDRLARQRFMQEARSLGQIDHENIVRIYRVEESPVPFLVMELVEGISLDRLLEDTQGGLELDLFRTLALQIARGLAVAHEHGLIHRDIKPGNILLTTSRPPGAKLTDFGLARRAGDLRLTMDGSVVGTPMYMSPEQIKDEVVDRRSDLFSLGTVFYEMLSGQTPFRGSNHFFVMNAIVDEIPRPLCESIKAIPLSLEQIVFKLLEKDPSRRYQAAEEVVDALVRMGKTESVPVEFIESVKGDRRLALGSFPLSVVASLVVSAVIAAIHWLPRVPPSFIDEPATIKQPQLPLDQPSIGELATDKPLPKAHPWVTELRIPFEASTAKEYQERWAESLGVDVEFVNTAGISMVLIPPGEYQIGFTPDEYAIELCGTDSNAIRQVLRSAGTQTWVRISFPFYISKYEISEAERFAILKDDHSPPTVLDLEGGVPRRQRERSPDYPITRVPWDETLLICRKLNEQEGLPIHVLPIGGDALGLHAYRLPTDAEWEWVARAGRSDCGLLSAEALWEEGWILSNSKPQLHPRGQKMPSPFGIYDMIGNAQEWCLDEFEETYYQGSSLTEPIADPLLVARNPYHRSHHILRGGSVIFKEDFSNYSFRTFRDPYSTSWFTGFRIVLPISKDKLDAMRP